MTIPEAIKWFGAKLMVNERFGLLGLQNEAAKLALVALQEQEDRMANPALTLDELREMDGMPVWVCEPDGANGVWGLVDLEYQMIRLHGGGLAIWENNDKSWLAYRHKPEEVKAT